MAKDNSIKPHYASILQSDVPQGRRGKHHATIERIMSDLEQLAPGRAMKLELARLSDSKENVRSALNRETRLRRIDVATSSDEHFLYIWKADKPLNGKGK